MKKFMMGILLVVGTLTGFSQRMEMTHDQFYIVPDNYCEVGDVVGQYYVNCTDSLFKTRSGDYKYSILSGNTGSAFKIDNVTGSISVASSSAINYGSDFKLKILTTVDRDVDTSLAVIHIVHQDSVYFIDPTFKGSETGKRAAPFNKWSEDIEGSSRMKSGFTYLIKRGTTCLSGDYIYIANNSNKRIYIGAYGKGERPIFDGRKTNTACGILIGGSWGCPLDASKMGRNIIIMDIHIKGYVSEYKNGVRFAPSSRDIQLHRLRVEDGHYNGCIYIGHSCNIDNQNILVQDCQALHNSVSHLLKAEGGGVTVINFYGIDAPNGTGISFPVSPNNTAKYFYLKTNGETGVNIRKENTHYSFGYITDIYRGVYLYNDNAEGLPYVNNEGLPYNSSLKNIIIKNAYTNGIELEDGYNTVIENVDISNSGGSAIRVKSDLNNLKISKCSIYNNKGDGIEINGNSTNISLSYNIITKNTIGINIKSSGANVKVHNNTLTQNRTSDAANTASAKFEFINNAYENLNTTQWNPISNNSDIPDRNCFVNAAMGDYTPVKGSSLIDQGKDLAYNSDFKGNKVPQNRVPDIGALEYSTTENNTPVTVNKQPVIADQSFKISQATGKIVIGKIIASDPDAGQVLSYTISKGNENGIFELDQNTGELSCSSDDINFNAATTYSLNVLVSDNGSPKLTNSAVVSVQSVMISYTYYIDPQNASDSEEDGSFEHPFDSWEDVVWKSGYSYLQKCNTSANVSSIVVSANNVTIGSYGEGTKPVLNSSTDNYAIKFFERSNITIKNLSIKTDQALSSLYFLGSTTNHIVVENCEFESFGNGIRIVEGGSVVLKNNVFKNCQEGIYSSATNTELNYNLFISNKTAINANSSVSTVNICNNVFYDNTQGLSMTYASVTAYNNVFYMTHEGDLALDCNLKSLISDNNVFYPEQTGFIKMGSKSFDRLIDFQQELNQDKNSTSKNPLFYDADNFNFIPKKGSPVIDKGRFLGQTTDIKGNLVPNGGAPDIGVFELQEQDQSVTEHLESNAITLFPNPTNGVVHVRAEEATTDWFQLRVSDLSGKVVYFKYLIAGVDKVLDNIDLSDLPKGIYIVNVINDFINYSGKVTLY